MKQETIRNPQIFWLHQWNPKFSIIMHGHPFFNLILWNHCHWQYGNTNYMDPRHWHVGRAPRSAKEVSASEWHDTMTASLSLTAGSAQDHPWFLTKWNSCSWSLTPAHSLWSQHYVWPYTLHKPSYTQSEGSNRGKTFPEVHNSSAQHKCCCDAY